MKWPNENCTRNIINEKTNQNYIALNENTVS